jgi:hypothetical protein
VSLSDWVRNGWLIAHTTSANEVRDLLAVVARDLADSSVPALSPEWRMSIAYNAALQASTAALAAAGYRASRDSHHFRVIESLAMFDAYRKKRNISGYERVGMVSDADADGMRKLALELRDLVMRWLGEHHPRLLPAAKPKRR